MNKKIHSGTMLMLLLVGMLTWTFDIQPVTAEPRTWYVDDDGGADFTKIQDAMDAANSGDTIEVAPGIYSENILVTKNDMTLLGSGAYVTTINGQDKGNVVYAYGVASFSIEGFTIRNSSHTGYIPGSVGVHMNPVGGGDFAIRKCRIQDNWDGIAIWNHRWGSIIVENNLISNNDGEGLDASYPILTGEAIIRCNTIACNGRSGYYDWAGGGHRSLINNVIVSNEWYGIYSHRDTPRYIAYNDVWNNTKGNHYEGYFGPPTPFPPSPGIGEISVDPQFADAANRDYHLNLGSPCIDTGNNDNAASSDFEGNPRPIDGDGDGIGIVDMGAFESIPLPRTIAELKTKAEELGSEGGIDNRGIVKSLLAKLNVAQKLVDEGKTDQAKNLLNTFINEVQAQSGKHISPEAAELLIESAEYIMSNL